MYFLYEAYQAHRRITFQVLKTKLESMNDAGYLLPALSYLRLNGYVDGSYERLGLTGKGLRTTELLFRKFFIYLKRHRDDELSTWINSL